jgi:hypothetical protein
MKKIGLKRTEKIGDFVFYTSLISDHRSADDLGMRRGSKKRKITDLFLVVFWERTSFFMGMGPRSEIASEQQWQFGGQTQAN